MGGGGLSEFGPAIPHSPEWGKRLVFVVVEGELVVGDWAYDPLPVLLEAGFPHAAPEEV